MCSFFFWNNFADFYEISIWFEFFNSGSQPLNHLPFDVCLPFQFHSCCVPCLNWHNNMGLVVILWWTCVSHPDENGDVKTRLLNVYDDDLAEFWSLISLTIYVCIIENHKQLLKESYKLLFIIKWGGQNAFFSCGFWWLTSKAHGCLRFSSLIVIRIFYDIYQGIC